MFSKTIFYKIMFSKKIIILVIPILWLSQAVWGQDNIRHEMQQHFVYHNVFNSTLITPDIAKNYHLVRAKDRVYLNIAVVKKTGGYGIPTNIKGTYRNLMQQQQVLDFVEINEATATYYLAPIRFDNEEILHIDVDVSLKDSSDSARFTITKKLYRD